ncbi:unnamed protein product [Cyprideis torosa]|uniref:Uncharacterized protein n=1 Tax=Cyprideis torosa TaxID=163714 RepID=A0A7R8WDJ3_9CRUS|nr:unnamed protein product [Cyprideis torosa]CAG0894709.1 unnamed protein product [Cyprideis torosa]
MRIDNDGDLVISYEEWRDFLLFHPMVEDIRSLINYWRLATDLSETPAHCAVPSSRPFLSLKAPVWWDTPLDEDGIPQMSAPFLMNLDDLDVSLVSEHLGLKPPAPEYHDDYCARGIQHGVEVLPSALRHRHLLQLPPSSVLPRSTKPPSMTGPLVGRGLKEMWKPNKPWDICTSLSWHKRLPRFYGVADIGEDLKIPSDLTESEIIAGMWWRHLLAGAAAGAVSRTATAPLDRIKTFLQVHGKEHSNLFHLVKAMIEEGGLVSLWRGNGMNVIKIAPESAIKFMMYEQTKRALKGKRKGEVTISERFLAGSFSGAFAQTIVYPMEVLKTRMALRRTGEFKNARDACMKIYTREGGVKAFYRGFIPNLLGILPMAGIDLLVFTPAGHEPPRMTEIFRTVIANEGMIGLYRGVAPNLMKVIPAVSLSYVLSILLPSMCLESHICTDPLDLVMFSLVPTLAFIASLSAGVQFGDPWGPGLRPDLAVFPVHYFFVPILDGDDEFLRKEVSFRIQPMSCRAVTEVLEMKPERLLLLRYRLFASCRGLTLLLQYRSENVRGFPRAIENPAFHEYCNCPNVDQKTWQRRMGCASTYPQIEKDLQQFPSVLNFTESLSHLLKMFTNPGGQSYCQYVIRRNRVFRKCYGEHVGFNLFVDNILLSLSRKYLLPEFEMMVNLGDWPQINEERWNLPMFSWCGSKGYRDIVMPTYDLTEATLNAMDTVAVDILSVLGDGGEEPSPPWNQKISKGFWRGRDSREDRLRLVKLSKENWDILEANLTRMFFFRDRLEEFNESLAEPIALYKFFDYKYQISLDGTVAAYRLPYLLAGSSAVFKQDSTYYEHFYSLLHPSTHFIPIQSDLSDLISKLRWAQRSDSTMQRVSLNARKFVLQHLLPRDILCYYSVLLEHWARRLSPVESDLPPDLEAVPQPTARYGYSDCSCGSQHDKQEL